MSLASHPTNASAALGLRRVFTTEGVHPYDTVEWERRDARIHDWRDGTVAFEQLGVEVPACWSINASNILAQKYFRGTLGTPERETSLRQVIDRVVNTITEWGVEASYFATPQETQIFADELRHLIVSQKAAFNSPVWFNLGVDGVPQQASACFILSVEDQMESILNWYAEEGMIFKGGSGAGVNLSAIRSSVELLEGGGTASGPVSFMRGADASAGTIKSGGKTRRAAKMVILDINHPDVAEFVWCKAREERKARALRDAGFDMDLDGEDSFSIQYQNANNSVRITDEFMTAVENGDDWHLRAVTDGTVVRTLPARELFRDIAQAAWECADPGLQFDTTINRWHTTPSVGRINASNPCSEYMHVDNSACNLASLNLLAFQSDAEDDNGGFDVDGYIAACEIVFAAQEIIVGRADYPTERIGDNTRMLRQIGLGYANLGALLMTLGAPYDSDRGRAIAATLTAIMGGAAYNMSARLAERVGPFAGYENDAEAVQRVLGMHRAAVDSIDRSLVPTGLHSAAQAAWDDTCVRASTSGVRNAQATVLAPTGTISFLMDCDTTGIEPDLGLVKMKKLVGGGTMSIVNQGVHRALRRLGYDDAAAQAIVDHISATGSVIGAPGLDDDHVAVFACSMGDNVIGPDGHIAMMAAVQPFLSGAISKTVNLPEDTTVEQVEKVYADAWKLGLKAVALYRDNCKLGQPLTAKKAVDATPETPAAAAEAVVAAAATPVREKLPRSRSSRTFEFRVADCKGFVTVGEYADGRPGELFIRVSKQGSTLAGIMDAFAIAVSHGLQYGVPLTAFVDAFVGMRFEPAGMTDDEELRIASSLMDYLFRRMAVEYLPENERRARNILTTGERSQPTLPGVVEATTATSQGLDLPPDPPAVEASSAVAVSEDVVSDAPFCGQCGTQMVRAGSCYACRDCGSTSGCS